MAPADPTTGSEGQELLPVTVLSGFLGAGKTTLLKHILRSAGQSQEALETGDLPPQAGMKIAVIVNDMGEVNLDASEIKSSKLIQEEAAMVELHNGCICCTLRGDLLKTVKALSEENEFDYLVIESTGISEPMPVAQTFVMDVDNHTFAMPPGAEEQVKEAAEKEGVSADSLVPETASFKSLSHFSRLDTMATVVDALNIYDVLGSLSTLSENNVTGMVGNTGVSLEEHTNEEEEHRHEDGTTHTHTKQSTDDRSIAQLMLDQIEFADVILLSKAHLLAERVGPSGGPKAVQEITTLLRKLNPVAKVIVPNEPNFADVPLEELIDTQLFDMRKAQMSSGWLRELIRTAMGGGHMPETEEYGISSVVFRTRDRPFHPGRLQDILSSFGDYASSVAKGGPMQVQDSDASLSTFAGVVRAKGQVWAATCNDRPVHVHAAGRFVKLEPGVQPYLASIPPQEWTEPHQRHYKNLVSQGGWHSKNGDREVELVLIGIGLDKAKVLKELKAALLTKKEAAEGPESWNTMEDPLFGGRFQN